MLGRKRSRLALSVLFAFMNCPNLSNNGSTSFFAHDNVDMV